MLDRNDLGNRARQVRQFLPAMDIYAERHDGDLRFASGVVDHHIHVIDNCCREEAFDRLHEIMSVLGSVETEDPVVEKGVDQFFGDW